VGPGGPPGRPDGVLRPGGTDSHRLTDGLSGADIAGNIMDGYRWPVHNREPGATLLRLQPGETTVRSLAAFIRDCGLL